VRVEKSLAQIGRMAGDPVTERVPHRGEMEIARESDPQRIAVVRARRHRATAHALLAADQVVAACSLGRPDHQRALRAHADPRPREPRDVVQA